MAPLNGYLLRSALVAALGALLFGFDTAVISGTTRSLTETFSLSPALLGTAASSALWGTVVGAFGAGRPSDRFGRRFTNLLFTVASMSVINRFGRRKLLLTGAICTAICLAGVAAIFATGQRPQLLLRLLIGFIASFAFSQGAVIWVYLSEVFPNLVRAKGQSPAASLTGL
jgi:MFS family permease